MNDSAQHITAKLEGKDRRRLGRVDEVVRDVLRDRKLLAPVVKAMASEDAAVRMRAADAVEKISAEKPVWIRPHKRFLLTRVAAIPQQEVRWHFCQILPRLSLTPAERKSAFRLALRFLRDESSIVKTFAMQALYELGEQDTRLRLKAAAEILKQTRSGTPAMRARGKKLLKQF